MPARERAAYPAQPKPGWPDLANPIELDARIRPSFYTSRELSNFRGRGTLIVESDGMRFVKRGIVSSSQITVAWRDLRALDEQLTTRRRFTADFGIDGKETEFTVKVAADQVALLAPVLQRLPAEVLALRCTKCGGHSVAGVCRGCGAHLGVVRRSNGLMLMTIGIIVAGIGLAITLGSYDRAAEAADESGAGTFYVMYGLILGGAGTALRGLFKVIFGR